MTERQRTAEQMFQKSEKPSEDFSRSWHIRQPPSFDESPSGDRTGKWCIFAAPVDVDSAWVQIKRAVDRDKLFCAKVSTGLRSLGRDGHVICVYTRDWEDGQDVFRVREILRSLGFVEELGYKRDIDTLNGVYGPGEWYLRE
jgi:hypothetical protein